MTTPDAQHETKDACQPDDQDETHKSQKKVKPNNDDAQVMMLQYNAEASQQQLEHDSTSDHSVKDVTEKPNEASTAVGNGEAKQPSAEHELFALNKTTLDNIQTNPDKLKSFLRQLGREIEKVKGDKTLTRDEYGDKRGLLGNLKGIAKRCLESLAEAAARRRQKLHCPPRLENVDFEIVSQQLLHDFDVHRFKDSIRELFRWYTDDAVRVKFMAPCRPLVQSSGMGKTKLLWELYRELVMTGSSKEHHDEVLFSNCFCEMVLCAYEEFEEEMVEEEEEEEEEMEVEEMEEEEEVYSSILDVPSGNQPADTKRIYDQLDAIVKKLLINVTVTGRSKTDEIKVVLLFDESQRLLKRYEFAYRVIRKWLCRQHNFSVVAVFAGTTLQLANVSPDPPVSLNARDANIHYESGTCLFDPFYQICSIGLFARHHPTIEPANDYERAVPYGRPLFALMQEKGKLDEQAEFKVLSGMLMSKAQTWRNELDVCLSVLGTRLQMGQPAVKVASDLVAKGYAVLSHYVAPTGDNKDSAETARTCIFFPTDSVCARLAMALMDETWTVTSPSLDDKLKIYGQAKWFWARTISKVFTTGLCRPPQSDFSELAAASYLLFCGDILRMRIDKTYRTFSVPLSDFFECLVKPNICYDARRLPPPPDGQAKVGYKYSAAYVNFIQVTRNYLRLSVKDFFHEEFLRDLYYSGSAFFTCPMFTEFDLVASIRLVAAESCEDTFVPLLVSASTEMYIGTQRDWLDKIIVAIAGPNALRMVEEDGASKIRVEEGRRTMTMDDIDVALEPKPRGSCYEATKEEKMVTAEELAATSGSGIMGPDGKGFVGLRILFNRSETTQCNIHSADVLSVDDVDRLLRGEVVWKVVVVPADDPFGIVDMLVDATMCGSERSEIYSSHSFAFNHSIDDLESDSLVRTTKATETASYLDAMRSALLESRTVQQSQPATELDVDEESDGQGVAMEEQMNKE